jgi:predicted small integral membrane protein
MLAIRLAKIICVAALALFMALVAFGNVTDYSTNFAFVANVLNMDEVQDGAAIRWRAATSPALHQLAYLAIIATEIAIAALAAFGVAAMLRALTAGALAFQRAKGPAIIGLALGFLLYEGGFIAVASEWFGMWRMPGGGAEESAFRIALTMLAALIFVSLKDEDVG